MIPNAETLAQILNDPAIPAEAKPGFARFGDSDWVAGSEFVVVRSKYLDTLEFSEAVADVNAALFWSLSAWLWGQGVFPRVEVHGNGAACPWAKGMDFGIGSGRSPLEALAAVVREVATR